MTDLNELRMNVAALKRVDPYVKDILETATHVALYTFNAVNNEWEKTDIEGALFVYSRNGEPYNSVLIMNRLNTNNLVEPVTQGLDLQLQEPFLLYRNSRCNIYGIWFYEKEECIRIGAMLNKLVAESKESKKPLNVGKAPSEPSGNNVDIFSLLSKAQEDFNTTRNPAGVTSAAGASEAVSSKSPTNDSHVTGPLTAPLGPDVTSQSVMDFFAKAKVNTGHFKPGDQPPAGGSATAESKPLLARLMSHPAAHTLEHIEKQHRSVTPQPGNQQQNQRTPTAILNINNLTSGTASNKSKRRSKTALQQDSMITAAAATSVSQDVRSTLNQCTADANGTSGFHRIQSPTNPTAVFDLSSSQSTETILSNNVNPLASLFGHSMSTAVQEEQLISAPPLSGRGSAPALIPPGMFAAPSPPENLARPLEPLTRNQLLQAFNYLLRSDPDFINKLHEAYVKSFGEILS